VAATIGCNVKGDKRRRWWFAVAATSSLSLSLFLFSLFF